ncbi:MAG TPA: prenyltransferase [Anaerolineales bacterium]|nr:prenyltransferase [Anaerolineales bacterium]
MAVPQPAVRASSPGDLVRNWKEVIDTCNLSPDKRMDFVSRWLVLMRACVFQMSLTSGLIGGLLAVAAWRATGVPSEGINGPAFLLTLIGLVLAHAANNLSNDFFDLQEGLDTKDYPRALYAPHPVLSGLTTQRGLATAFISITLIDAVIALYLTYLRGPLVLAFAAAGLLISLFYTAWPLKLKYRGLGELGVFLVWGPLMIGGTYFVVSGTLPSWIWLACLPYALAVTTVVMGKHLDKLPYDKPRGVRTLAVILGETSTNSLIRGMMVAFYVISLGLVLAGIVSVWVLLVLLSLPRLVKVWKIYRQPKPSAPPENYSIWPLWFVSWAFYWVKQAGTLLAAGIILGALFPIFVGR